MGKWNTCQDKIRHTERLQDCTCTHQSLGNCKPHSKCLWKRKLQSVHDSFFSPKMLWERFLGILICFTPYVPHFIYTSKSYQIVLLFSVEPTGMWRLFYRNSWKRKSPTLTEWICRLKSWLILQQTEPNPHRGDHHQAWSHQSTLVTDSYWFIRFLRQLLSEVWQTSDNLLNHIGGANHHFCKWSLQLEITSKATPTLSYAYLSGKSFYIFDRQWRKTDCLIMEHIISLFPAQLAI